MPSRIQLDRGEQLVMASKQLAVWDFKGVQEWAGKNGIEWHLVSTSGEHFNGQAERMIEILKKQIWRSFEGRKYTHEEMCTVLQEAAQVVNSHPLTAGPWAERDSLCPEDVMLGRARTGMPVAHFETGQQLVKRFRIVQEAKEEFWDRWVKELFPSLLKQKKWYKYKRDMRVGDVLRKDETPAGQTYMYARVVNVHVGSDGRARTADVEYRIPGEAKFWETTRPIHKLILVVPVEEQTTKEKETPEASPEKNEIHWGAQDPTNRAGPALKGEDGKGNEAQNLPKDGPKGPEEVEGGGANK